MPTKRKAAKRPADHRISAAQLAEVRQIRTSYEELKFLHSKLINEHTETKRELAQVRARLNEACELLTSARGEVEIWKATARPLMRSLLGMVPEIQEPEVP